MIKVTEKTLEVADCRLSVLRMNPERLPIQRMETYMSTDLLFYNIPT